MTQHKKFIFLKVKGEWFLDVQMGKTVDEISKKANPMKLDIDYLLIQYYRILIRKIGSFMILAASDSIEKIVFSNELTYPNS
jgi:hypothetical protein